MKPRVLFVDDQQVARDWAELALREYEVVTAKTLREAADQPGPFHLLILDVRLPDGDGRSLRLLWPGVPWIIVSGYPIDEIFQEPWYVAKPWHSEQFRELIHLRLRGTNV